LLVRAHTCRSAEKPTGSKLIWVFNARSAALGILPFPVLINVWPFIYIGCPWVIYKWVW